MSERKKKLSHVLCKQGEFDVVLACDVLYNPEAVDAIAALVLRLFGSGSSGAFILADPPGRFPKNHARFLSLMEDPTPVLSTLGGTPGGPRAGDDAGAAGGPAGEASSREGRNSQDEVVGDGGKGGVRIVQEASTLCDCLNLEDETMTVKLSTYEVAVV